MGEVFKEIFGFFGTLLQFGMSMLGKLGNFFGLGDSDNTSGLGSIFNKVSEAADAPVQAPDFMQGIFNLFKPANPNGGFMDYLLDVVPRVFRAIVGANPDGSTRTWDEALDHLGDEAIDGVSSLKKQAAGVASGLAVTASQFAGSVESSFRGDDTRPRMDSGAAPAVNGQGLTVVTLGDSQANGMSAALAGSHANVINLAKDGNGKGLSAVMREQDISQIPKGAIVMMDVGTNDVAGLTTQGQIDEYAARLVNHARSIRDSRGAAPVIIGMQRPMDEKGNIAGYTGNPGMWDKPGFPEQWTATMKEVNKAVQKKAQEAGIAYSATEGRIPPEERQGDHLHYQVKGYKRIMANALDDAGIGENPSLRGKFGQQARPAPDTPPAVDLSGLTPVSDADIAGTPLGKEANELLQRERPSWDGQPPATAIGRKFAMNTSLVDKNGEPVQVVGVIMRHPKGSHTGNFGDGFGADGVTPDPDQDHRSGWHNGITLFTVNKGASPQLSGRPAAAEYAR